jgi:hypothetical protein
MYYILATILSIPTAFAAISGGIDTEKNPPISSVKFESPFGSGGTVESVLNNIVNYATIIAAPIATVLVMYGAFQILTAQGKPLQIEAGKKTVKYALGGLAVVMVARLLVSIVSGITKGLV